jgi:hypothetical protein
VSYELQQIVAAADVAMVVFVIYTWAAIWLGWIK